MGAAREHLGLEVSFVSEFEGGQRVFRYVGGDLQRFQVCVEGTEPLDQTYCQKVVAGAMGPLIRDAANDPVAAAFAVTEELGVGAYLGVPVQFSSGRLYGTLCCLSGATAPDLSERDVLFMRMAAALVAEQLEREEVASEERRTMVRRIRAAIDERRFAIVYQPIVSLESGTVLGYEALSRFAPPPARPPQAWFDEAWLVGLGAELELATASAALDGLPRVPDAAYLALNFSPETLLSPELDKLLDPSLCPRLVVEITEHARVLDYEPVRRRLDFLRARGVRFAIDDLGTGHAGVSHLLEFRPEILKVDLSVVQGVRRDKVRRAIAATFATFAAHLGIELVAEGIERAEDQEALEILGLTAGQGFHIAEPGPLPGARIPPG
jgi:EAL domain-containing protein (putative c-di-GMP-specific phosphodiesterase class I)